MTDTDLYWITAHRVCTPDELHLLHLADIQGLGTRRIALILHRHRSTIRDRLAAIRQKIAAELDQGAAA